MWSFISNLPGSTQVLLADERFPVLFKQRCHCLQGILVNLTCLKNFFSPSIFQWIHLFHCLIQYLLCLHLLLLLTATLLPILPSSQLLVSVSEIFLNPFLSFHHAFSQTHLFYKLFSDLWYKALLAYSLYKIFKLLEFLFFSNISMMFLFLIL